MNGPLDDGGGERALELSAPHGKDALRPGTMPGYGRTPKPKRKRNYEPKAAMAQRLADDSRSIWTLEDCERMTWEQLLNRLQDLGLPGRLSATLSGQSWEELKAAKVASDEKAAAAKVEKAATGASPSASRSPSLRWRWRSGWRMIVARSAR